MVNVTFHIVLWCIFYLPLSQGAFISHQGRELKDLEKATRPFLVINKHIILSLYPQFPLLDLLLPPLSPGFLRDLTDVVPIPELTVSPTD